jgi:EAL domain-containing protein (putative c-di-GMP-specific phosphodiesterase class I)
MACKMCKEDVATPDFTMAFQPIVDLSRGEVFAYESLVRPLMRPGQPAGSAHDILSQIDDTNRYAFDQACRVKSISLAASLGMESFLSINFLPNAVYQPAACLRKTLQAAAEFSFPAHRIIFEVTEAEPSRDPAHLKAIFTEYKSHGMITAIDDFGAGHSGLNLLADFQPDIVKIDMNLTRGIQGDRARRAIVRAIAGMCEDLGISLIAEGIEHMDEVHTLVDLKVNLFQGFLFARPAVEKLPLPDRDVLVSLSGSATDLRRLEAS